MHARLEVPLFIRPERKVKEEFRSQMLEAVQRKVDAVGLMAD